MATPFSNCTRLAAAVVEIANSWTLPWAIRGISSHLICHRCQCFVNVGPGGVDPPPHPCMYHRTVSPSLKISDRHRSSFELSSLPWLRTETLALGFKLAPEMSSTARKRSATVQTVLVPPSI